MMMLTYLVPYLEATTTAAIEERALTLGLAGLGSWFERCGHGDELLTSLPRRASAARSLHR
jgi:hypothetical protein